MQPNTYACLRKQLVIMHGFSCYTALLDAKRVAFIHKEYACVITKLFC